MNLSIRIGAESATIVACLVVLSVAPPALGEEVEFTLDPDRSVYTVSGTVAGATLGPQTPGSNVGRFGGRTWGELNSGLLHLEFADVRGLYQPLPQQPGNDTPDAGPAVFGFRGDVPGGGTLLAAIPNISFYVSTRFARPLDVADGAFSTEDVGFFLDSSLLYHTGGETVQHRDLHGYGGNDVPRQGSFVTSGGVQTLTLPFETHFSFDLEAPDDWNLSFVGQLVATRVVPEPVWGTWLLLAVGAAGCRRRRRRP
jgi:hypothetical protein